MLFNHSVYSSNGVFPQVNKDKSIQDFKTKNLATLSWLLLIALTIVAVLLASFIDNRSLYIVSALSIVVIKGQQIVDVFMELHHAPKLWRWLLLSYIILIPFIIAVIYLV